MTGKWDKLEEYFDKATNSLNANFNIGVSRALLALGKEPRNVFTTYLDDVRRSTAKSLSATNTTSLQACHDVLLRLHALRDIEAIGSTQGLDPPRKRALAASLDQRLELLGPFISDKQYILGLRRAAMQLSK